jgi:hypothetical protein
VGAVAGLAVLALTIAVVIGDRACFIAPMWLQSVNYDLGEQIGWPELRRYG